jgi:cytochrome c oxidase subunit 3
MESSAAATGPSRPEKDNLSFGFPIFLLSESVVFLSFFVTYALLRTQTTPWFPPGVTGLDLPLAGVNTIILVSSSVVIHRAGLALEQGRVVAFRRLWLLTAAMGTVFLAGQAQEWSRMSFGLDAGLAGGTFYLLTGFHGLHVLIGVSLILLMYLRSLRPGNFDGGHQGVEAVSLFWHFVDGIWLVLFGLLYLWR